MKRLDICSDCIHYNVCEDAHNYKSECINYLSENDVVRVRHGKWILNHGIIDYCTCSCCGSMISQSQINRFYCPRCGTQMDLEDTE